MEKINFEEVLQICRDFIENPQEKTKVVAFENLEARLVIRSYLPMEEKVIALYRMVIDSDKPMDLVGAIFTAGLELACLFDGLLAYTNIDGNIPINLKIYESYDVIYQSGLADYILDFCKRDYDRLVRLIERTISYDNLTELTKTINQIDNEGMEKIVKEFKKFREETDPKVLHDISDIVRYNDPNLYSLKEDVVDGVLDQIERLDKLEKIKK